MSSTSTYECTVATKDTASLTSELSPLFVSQKHQRQSQSTRSTVILFRILDWISDGLGFTENPLFDSNHRENDSNTITHPRNTAAADLRLSMLSNFSTAYNVLTISVALTMMEESIDRKITAADKSQCSSALLAGMILGQLAGGALGDLCGRHIAMSIVMLLQVIGAIMSSLAVDVSLPQTDSIILINRFSAIAFWRAVLGLGCGGVYPLAATLIANSQDDAKQEGNDPLGKAKRVALAFSFQGVGYLAVPIAAWAIISIIPPTSDLAWRVLLGSGALPGIFLTILRLRRLSITKQQSQNLNSESTSISDNNKLEECESQQVVSINNSNTIPSKPSLSDSIRNEQNLWRKLIGTGGCWFLFDILFYGNTLFQPVVLSHAFGPQDETIGKAVHDTALVATMALPGYFVSVRMIGNQSPRYIQMQGFLIMGLLYTCISLFFDELGQQRFVLLGLYGSTFVFSNYGPNATTFLLPAMTFSRNCRATLNGVCAACGKVGALLGASIFVMAVQQFGEPVVFACCAVLSIIGLVITLVCVEEGVDTENQNDEKENDAAPAMRPSFSMPSLFDYYHSSR